MRVITVDNGNTNPHVGIFQNEKLDSVIALKDYIFNPNDFILISDVGSPLSFKPTLELKSKRITTPEGFQFFDMPVQYTKTLGDDRLISSYSIFKNSKPHEKILIIDAGTFITTDLITTN
jgi:type III pantothenate kinase